MEIENSQRFILFPIKYPNFYSFYKKAVKSFWTPEEIDLDGDLNDWESLSNNEQHFIKNVLAFFACSDGIVLENLAQRFYNDTDIAEIRLFYGFQIAIENIHSETYSLLIDTYIKSDEEKQFLFKGIDNIPAITKKAQWALKWINGDEKENSYAKRLVAFAIVEGIFFSGSFCAIFWLKRKGLMKGLTFSNELISRDEALHCEFAIEIYNTLLYPNEKLKNSEIVDIIKEAVEIETEFINDALQCTLIGMNSSDMTMYIKFCGDRLLKQLGYPPIWDAKQPFAFMEQISLQGKTNFFEKRVGEYTKVVDSRPTELVTDSDF